MTISAAAYAPNRYRCVQMNTASLNYAPTKGCACSSLKGVPLHCIIFRTSTDPAYGSGSLFLKRVKYPPLGEGYLTLSFVGQMSVQYLRFLFGFVYRGGGQGAEDGRTKGTAVIRELPGGPVVD